MTSIYKFEEYLAALYGEADGRFDALVKAANLDKKRDFRNRDLRALRFDRADLSGFDFSGSDLRGTGLRKAKIYRSTKLYRALVDNEDATWLERQHRENNLGHENIRPKDLRRALNRGEFTLVYQPIYHFQKIISFRSEVLVRWKSEEYGNVQPASFIPAMEEADMIADLTYFVLEEAVADQRRMSADGIDCAMAINISTALFDDHDFVSNCLRIIHRRIGDIRFEVPEHIFALGGDDTRSNIGILAEAGVTFAIDNYGTGFSTLRTLQSMGAAELKIDRTFVKGVDAELGDNILFRNIVEMGHALGMTVTAVGVETVEEMNGARAMGCDEAQGYLLGMPLSVIGLTEVLAQGTPQIIR